MAVVFEKFIYHIAQLRPAGQDEMVQALLLDGLDEGFHIAVQLGGIRRGDSVRKIAHIGGLDLKNACPVIDYIHRKDNQSS